MKNRKCVNRIVMSASVDKKLHKRFKELSDTTLVPMSRLFDEAIKLLLEKREGK